MDNMKSGSSCAGIEDQETIARQVLSDSDAEYQFYHESKLDLPDGWFKQMNAICSHFTQQLRECFPDLCNIMENRDELD